MVEGGWTIYCDPPTKSKSCFLSTSPLDMAIVYGTFLFLFWAVALKSDSWEMDSVSLSLLRSSYTVLFWAILALAYVASQRISVTMTTIVALTLPPTLGSCSTYSVFLHSIPLSPYTRNYNNDYILAPNKTSTEIARHFQSENVFFNFLRSYVWSTASPKKESYQLQAFCRGFVDKIRRYQVPASPTTWHLYKIKFW